VAGILLLDTSVAVALLVEDHEAHQVCRAAVAGFDLGLAGHATFETMSVLTRLPGSGRRPIEVIRTAVSRSFPSTRFLSPKASAALVNEIADLGISGGSIFDALVAAAAREYRLPLATRDVRALATYRAMGVELHAIV